MIIEIQLPQDVAEKLKERWGDLSLYAAEILAVEGYRSGTLTAEELHRTLALIKKEKITKSDDSP
jgi:hypothetical protein